MSAEFSGSLRLLPAAVPAEVAAGLAFSAPPFCWRMRAQKPNDKMIR
jgi:hypothetical protein